MLTHNIPTRLRVSGHTCPQVEVGDDAVAIMSGNDNSGKLLPTRGVVFRRLFVRGRSVAIGSADSGNVTDVLFEDCGWHPTFQPFPRAVQTCPVEHKSLVFNSFILGFAHSGYGDWRSL